MKINIISVSIIILCLAGCVAQQHYYIQDDGRIKLVLRAPEARNVSLACSLDKFTPHPAMKKSGGHWQVSVPEGFEFKYFYIVDGNNFIPECPYREKDDFGTENCVFSISE